MNKGYAFLSLLLIVILVILTPVITYAQPEINAKSSILIEASTGKVLYENNADEQLPIASVTKVMTMLLIMEALDKGSIKYDDMVTCSEYAASMGGSQVYLEPGEQMSVNDMLKAIAVASGNDAAVAMAEHIAGSETDFVALMNKRAKELGAKNTNFINVNGLDEDNHYSSARDVAIMSAELMKHNGIDKYLTIWMDELRGGEFGLANTNKLVRYYKGANGIKTGSTSKALYCLSAAAKRDGMQLIAVVLAAPTTKDRFNSASRLLDYGFAGWAVKRGDEDENIPKYIKVDKGRFSRVPIGTAGEFSAMVEKGQINLIEKQVDLPSKINAPVTKGQEIGSIEYKLSGKTIGKIAIVVKKDINKISPVIMMWNLFGRCVSFAY
ncbi:MAG: D-alanyl-D-alanine carboxypeptidase [Eubacteriales bacterium]|nr:D-alanyl-D-alanine carboxypeptidase [Eubacteriales bacterium]